MKLAGAPPVRLNDSPPPVVDRLAVWSLVDNMAFLKIDPSKVDALILSHGHYDHFGGLVPLLARHREAMRKDLDLYVGGEDAFCYRWFPAPQGAPEAERQSFGVLDRRDLEKANVRVVMAEEPMVIGDQAFTTGSIARTTFETVQPAAQIELGQREGAGCDASHFTPAEQAGRLKRLVSGIVRMSVDKSERRHARDGRAMKSWLSSRQAVRSRNGRRPGAGRCRGCQRPVVRRCSGRGFHFSRRATPAPS